VSSKALKKISLYGNTIGNGGAALLAGALRCNNTLYMLDLGGCGIGRAGVLELGLAIKDTPRAETWLLTEVIGERVCCEIFEDEVKLCDVAQELGFPTESGDWSNDRIMDEMSIVWRGKLLAFAMGLHPRLGRGREREGTTERQQSMESGEGSVVFRLDESLFGMIAEAYWGPRGTWRPRVYDL
jgi:hypothetical protein